MKEPQLFWYNICDGVVLTKDYEFLPCIIKTRSGKEKVCYLSYHKDSNSFISKYTHEDIKYSLISYGVIK